MNDEARRDWTHLLGIFELEGDDLPAAAKELLWKGRELADQLGVWLMAYSTVPSSGKSNRIISYGADVVFEANGAELNAGPALPVRYLQTQADLICRIIDQERPEIILCTSSPQTTALAARVAQRFKTGLAAECTSLGIDLAERKLLAVSPLYEGRLLQEYHWPERRPQMATLKAGAFPEAFSDMDREGSVRKIK